MVMTNGDSLSGEKELRTFLDFIFMKNDMKFI